MLLLKCSVCVVPEELRHSMPNLAPRTSLRSLEAVRNSRSMEANLQSSGNRMSHLTHSPSTGNPTPFTWSAPLLQCSHFYATILLLLLLTSAWPHLTFGRYSGTFYFKVRCGIHYTATTVRQGFFMNRASFLWVVSCMCTRTHMHTYDNTILAMVSHYFTVIYRWQKWTNKSREDGDC